MSTKRIPNVQRKKGYEIIKSSKDNFTGLGLPGGKFRKFGKSGAFVTHDEGEANYIRAAFGSRSATGDGSVVVCEVDNAGTRAPRRAFIINAPWKDKEDGIDTEGN